MTTSSLVSTTSCILCIFLARSSSPNTAKTTSGSWEGHGTWMFNSLWPSDTIWHRVGEWVIKFNTLRTRQNGHHFAEDLFKCIFLNENVWILIKISFNLVPEGQINNIPALVQIMAWRWPGDKPLSEKIMVKIPTHIYITRPQWVNSLFGDSGHQGPCSPYKPCNHGLYIGIIIFPHIDNTQYTGRN